MHPNAGNVYPCLSRVGLRMARAALRASSSSPGKVAEKPFSSMDCPVSCASPRGIFEMFTMCEMMCAQDGVTREMYTFRDSQTKQADLLSYFFPRPTCLCLSVSILPSDVCGSTFRHAKSCPSLCVCLSLTVSLLSLFSLHFFFTFLPPRLPVHLFPLPTGARYGYLRCFLAPKSGICGVAWGQTRIDVNGPDWPVFRTVLLFFLSSTFFYVRACVRALYAA